MKRLLTILLILSLPILTSAQLKVAILETVDKAQDVKYGVKLLLRTCLTTAISNTPGYEGYDRVDMASIAGEQEFQRTGNVSDDQIKQLGVATGAAYVLVAEAAKYDATNIIITAKMLDVETYGVISSAVAVSGTSAKEMKESCEQLAAQLITISKTAALVRKDTQTTKPAAKVDVSLPAAKDGEVGSAVVFPDRSRGVIFFKKYGVGLAMSIDATDLQWNASNNVSDITDIPNNANESNTFIAGMGEPYTSAIIKQLGRGSAPAAEWCANHGKGWYLPSAGELVKLFETIDDKQIGPMIKKALQLAGGSDFEYGWYWSSSECNAQQSIKVNVIGNNASDAKSTSQKVIAIRSFSY